MAMKQKIKITTLIQEQYKFMAIDLVNLVTIPDLETGDLAKVLI